MFSQVMCKEQRARVGNPECLEAIRDPRVQTRGSVHLACKQAYYKKLTLDPAGVQCPRPWNSETTAVSVVGCNAPLRRRSGQAKPQYKHTCTTWI